MEADRDNPWSGTMDEEDIEIIEVVGMDDDSPAASPVLETPELDDDEITLDFEADAEPDSAGAAVADEVPQAQPPAPVLEGDADELQERLIRLQADFENLQKRTERDQQEFRVRATSALILRLLPVIDNFERALWAEDGEGGQQLRQGVILIFRQLLEELRKEGLRPIEAEGQEFDPALHEAVESDEPGHAAYRVVDEVQRGYLLHGKLLRPSLVRVAAATDDDTPEAT